MADLKKLAEELVNLTVKDVKELADILKEEYGIEPAAAAVAVAAAWRAGVALAKIRSSPADTNWLTIVAQFAESLEAF